MPGVTKQSHKGCCSSKSRSLYAAEGHSAKTLGEMVTIPPVTGGKMMRGECKGVNEAYPLDKSAACPIAQVESCDVSRKSRIQRLVASSAVP